MPGFAVRNRSHGFSARAGCAAGPVPHLSGLRACGDVDQRVHRSRAEQSRALAAQGDREPAFGESAVVGHGAGGRGVRFALPVAPGYARRLEDLPGELRLGVAIDQAFSRESRASRRTPSRASATFGRLPSSYRQTRRCGAPSSTSAPARTATWRSSRSCWTTGSRLSRISSPRGTGRRRNTCWSGSPSPPVDDECRHDRPWRGNCPPTPGCGPNWSSRP